MRGSVSDPSGAAVSDVQIDLMNEGTQVSFRQATGAAGEYVFNLVPPGSYALKAPRKDFKPIL